MTFDTYYEVKSILEYNIFEIEQILSENEVFDNLEYERTITYKDTVIELKKMIERLNEDYEKNKDH